MAKGNPNIKNYAFKKGKDPRRNLTGPKVGVRIPDLLRRFGQWECPAALSAKLATLWPKINRMKLTVEEAEALTVRVAALRGESWAVQFIAERTEGKVSQPITGIEEINIKWRNADDMAPQPT